MVIFIFYNQFGPSESDRPRLVTFEKNWLLSQLVPTIPQQKILKLSDRLVENFDIFPTLKSVKSEKCLMNRSHSL